MSWKKYFTPVEAQGGGADGTYSAMGGRAAGQGAGPATSNYSSFLPDVYTGSPNRVERYGQYNTMDQDSEVNAALDILAEFCSQKSKDNNTNFTFNFNKTATNSEVQILGQYLKQWCKLNQFDTRLYRIFRNVFKYGDAFFMRDPETKKLFHVDPAKVTKIIVNESEGKKPEQYVVKDINFNFRDLVATTPYTTNGDATAPGSQYNLGGARGQVGSTSQSNSSI